MLRTQQSVAPGTNATQLDLLSKGIVPNTDNPWVAFFGYPNAKFQTTALDAFDRTDYNLPEAYIGKNLSMSQTLDDMIWTPEDFYTGYVMPWYISDDIHVEWNKWEFNQHVMDIVPEQGVSRLISSKRSARRESIYRRGLAFQLEHGWMETPEGRMTYAMSFLQIKNAVQQSANMGVVVELLTCQAHARQWEAEHGFWKKRTLSNLLEADKAMFAIFQRQVHGAEKLDSYVDARLNEMRGQADTWLVTGAAANHIKYRPENTEFYRGGQQAIENLNDVGGTAGIENAAVPTRKRQSNFLNAHRMLKRNRVYQTESFHVYGEESINLMHRHRQLGVFNVMVDDDTCSPQDYKTCRRTVRIYDEENDCGHNVTVQDAIRGCNVFDDRGQIRMDHIKNADNRSEWFADLARVFFLRPGPGGEPQPIRQFGDINEQFLSIKMIRKVAESIQAKFTADANTFQNLQRLFGLGHPVVRLGTLDVIRVDAGDVASAKELQQGRAGNRTLPVEAAEIQSSIMDAYTRTLGVLQSVSQGTLNAHVGEILSQFQAAPTEGAVRDHSVHRGYKVIGEQMDGVDALAKLLKGMQQQPEKYVNKTSTDSAAELASWSQRLEQSLHKALTDVTQSASSSSGINSDELQALRERVVAEGIIDPVSAQIPIMVQIASQFLAPERREQSQSAGRSDYSSFSDYVEPVGRMMGLDYEDLQTQTRIPEGPKLTVAFQEEDQFRDFAVNVRRVIDEGAGAVLQELMLFFLFTPFNRDTLVRMADNDIVVPVNFLLFRPNSIYVTARAIKVQAQGGAGYTYARPGNFILGDDAVRKMHYGNYTTYFRPIVINPENVWVQNDVYIDSIHKYCGVRVYDYNQRDDYAPDQGIYERDMFICMVPGDETDFPADMDVSGRFSFFFDLQTRDEQKRRDELHYTTAPYYNLMWDFARPEFKIMSDDIDWETERQRSGHNTWCTQARQAYYNPANGEFDRAIRRDTGHLGQSYAGARAWRNGQMEEYNAPPETGKLNF